MAENPDQDDAPALTDEDTQRQRLLGRIAVAAVVIVGLLGSLAVFDALYAPTPVKTPAKIATLKPPADDPVIPATPAATPPPPATDVPADAAQDAPKGSVPTDAAAATPKETTVAAAAPPLAPLPTERLTKPATAQATMAHPGAAVLPLPSVAQAPEGTGGPKGRGSELKREVAKSAAATTTVVRNAPASKPLTQATGSAPSGDMGRGFALQLGVFTNFANAEELRGKLEAAGIPATVEARVRAGPFASRADVDAARTKLRQLGISESILIAVRH